MWLAMKKNHKCQKYYTEKENGLAQDWTNEVVWCNPPYGREIGKWIKKGYESKALSVFWFQQEQIQDGFTIMFIEKIMWIMNL